MGKFKDSSEQKHNRAGRSLDDPAFHEIKRMIAPPCCPAALWRECLCPRPAQAGTCSQSLHQKAGGDMKELAGSRPKVSTRPLQPARA